MNSKNRLFHLFLLVVAMVFFTDCKQLPVQNLQAKTSFDAMVLHIFAFILLK